MRGAFGLLDRYVLRRFVGAYGLCLFGFVTLFLVVDFFSLLDNVLASEKAIEKAGYSLWPLVGEYYLTKLPLILTTVGPFLTLFAAIATLITFGRHNELTPMIAAGRSHHRVLAPVYASAVLAVFALVATEEYVLPQAMQRNDAIENLIKGGDRGDSRRPPHIRDSETGNAFAARTWLPSQRRLVDVHAPAYRDPSGRLPDGKFDAASVAWRIHPETREIGWFPVDGTLTPFVGAHDGVLPDPVRLPPDRPIAFKVDPSEIDLQTEAGEPGLSRTELAALIARYPQKNELRMQLYTRTTRPISGLVLLLLGLPFVTRPGQRTIAAGLGVALGTCAVYVGVDFFARQIGNRGELAPLVAAGLAPSLFGAIGLARIDRVSG